MPLQIPGIDVDGLAKRLDRLAILAEHLIYVPKVSEPLTPFGIEPDRFPEMNQGFIGTVFL